jgi:hypothetical protein
MVAYRLFFICGIGHFQRVRELYADHDGEALDCAAKEHVSGAMELWCGARKVGAWPRPPASPEENTLRINSAGDLDI